MMQQSQSYLQNTLNKLNENSQKFLELIFPKVNKEQQPKMQKTQVDKCTQTIDINQMQQMTNSTQLIFQQTKMNVVNDMIEELELKIAQKLEKQQQFNQCKQQIAQQKQKIENLKAELHSRLISKYGPNHIQVEKNQKEIEKLKKIIRKQQQQIYHQNQLNQKHELIENALQSIQQLKTLQN